MWYLQKSRPRYCWQNQICYQKRKTLNVKVLFIIIKVRNIQMFKYGISKCAFLNWASCLIQGIINYVQINTYWSFIVWITIFINLASNILLLASKKCFLTSQVLVGAGMNCRALSMVLKDLTTCLLKYTFEKWLDWFWV